MEVEGWGVGNEKVGGMRFAGVWLKVGREAEEGRRRVSIDVYVDVGVGVSGHEGDCVAEGVLRLQGRRGRSRCTFGIFETLLILDGSCSHDRTTWRVFGWAHGCSCYW